MARGTAGIKADASCNLQAMVPVSLTAALAQVPRKMPVILVNRASRRHKQRSELQGDKIDETYQRQSRAATPSPARLEHGPEPSQQHTSEQSRLRDRQHLISRVALGINLRCHKTPYLSHPCRSPE